MKIGITSSYDKNNYAFTLMHMLLELDIGPACMIIIEHSRIKRVKQKIRAQGAYTTFRQILQNGESVKADRRDFLRTYASEKGYADWGQSLSGICSTRRIPYIKSDKLNSPEVISFLKDNGIDLILNAGGGIFRNSFIDAVPRGILNAHMGQLPAFRGMNVLEWSLFYNQEARVTLHCIERGIDTGKILTFKEIFFEKGDTVSDMREKSLVVNVELMQECIPMLEAGKIQGEKQPLSAGKQYYVMHPKLKEQVERKLQSRG